MEKEVNTIPVDSSNEISHVADFFTGCNILITGGSGFVGKLLVEKLLRSCPNLNKIYLLTRPKKGKSSSERYKEQFEDVVYDRLKLEQPDFASKVVLVEGQLGEIGWKMSQDDRDLLKNSHIVFHAAATVRFDEKLRYAVDINIRGTKELLLFAREMPQLKAFVHIGTAFSHCVSKVIDEVFYKPPVGCDELLKLVDILDDSTLENITPGIIGKWPNTYAFTKTIGEDVIKKHSNNLPVCIVRPSIMIPTSEEPVCGWINNLYGATGVVFGAGIGVIRTLHCKIENVADIIPADYVINNIIVAAWDIHNQHSMKSLEFTEIKSIDDNENDQVADVDIEPPIYNSVSSCQNPITWGEYMKYNEVYGLNIPSALSVWYYCFTLNRYLWLHNIYVIFTHLLPAIIIDTLARLTGRKPMLLDTYKKIHKFSGVISYFCTQQWQFRNDNVMKLWKKLPSKDRKIFYFNLGELSWPSYFKKHILGVRLYLLNDPAETIPAALIKYKRLKYAHYGLMTVVYIFGIWLGYHILRFYISILNYIFF
ncbi:hypothetical protein HCN44_006273 [Aphidius gifuensis]|uniref:Fatty acyl-CoA reductase n=1 Tax=Aphidius gifuensis TaxID=684658 RepID=A0A835CTE9_APHGI|nr:fatty acyl-CoA reductase wat-like [Aphidius gifuensis]KAF7993213.1 hypothetical protein HCN44_006273 [Aphidius gifuensis]